VHLGLLAVPICSKSQLSCACQHQPQLPEPFFGQTVIVVIAVMADREARDGNENLTIVSRAPYATDPVDTLGMLIRFCVTGHHHRRFRLRLRRQRSRFVRPLITLASPDAYPSAH